MQDEHGNIFDPKAHHSGTDKHGSAQGNIINHADMCPNTAPPNMSQADVPQPNMSQADAFGRLDLQGLNDAQKQAVLADDRPLLVIAGAGSGKTKTIVHRLAYLYHRGIPADSMLLLTFTKKAAQEMLHRASTLLDSHLHGLVGGTFHAFAYNVLRTSPPSWTEGKSLNILDSADSVSILSHCKDEKKIGKGDRSFPKNQAILGLLSKARNKEIPLEEVLRRESQHLLPHLDALLELEAMYSAYRRSHFVLDYDDLLFELEGLLRENDNLLNYMHQRYSHIMVDEYQDTNKVQARLVRLIAGKDTSVMAVGDDAQSIYAFRGADVQNILDFPKLFKDTQIIRLEENYRSIQPILHVANAILESAPSGYQKNLYSKREYDESDLNVHVYRPLSDISQARLGAKKINELLQSAQPHEIAVLFRAGYQSYHLEVELNKLGIPFKKFGGVRYTEAAHIKDVLSFARLLVNPLDFPAFERIASLSKGIGPKTAQKLFALAIQGNNAELKKACAKFEDFWDDLNLIVEIQQKNYTPEQILRTIIEHYQPRMEWIYPDDWPRRQQGLEELVGIASAYQELTLFMADLSLENPTENLADEEDADERKITLSTVHSAKGLEWEHVFILDLVEDRFPSRHALTRPEDYEEERRLLYVACTRAKDSLGLFVPQNLFQRGQGFEERATPSPFVREIPNYHYQEFFEQYGGVLITNSNEKHRANRYTEKTSPRQGYSEVGKRGGYGTVLDGFKQKTTNNKNTHPNIEHEDNQRIEKTPAKKLGFCSHKVFGRGKVVEEIDAEKIRVNFTGFGLKVIMRNYVTFE